MNFKFKITIDLNEEVELEAIDFRTAFLEASKIAKQFAVEDIRIEDIRIEKMK